MVDIRRKCVQVGIVGALLVGLAVNAKPLPKPEVEPQLTAGAAKLPIVDWRTTEVEEEIIKEIPETAVVTATEDPGTDPAPAEPEDLPDEETSVGEPTELDLLYRVVQAEGFTLGVEGMQYITDAILNLARSRGCSIYEVLTSGAYTVVNTGAIWRQSIYSETIAAVDAELGGQLDYEIKYFRTNYFHGFGTPCFAYGNVYFSS